jgi:hypothetical protein
VPATAPSHTLDLRASTPRPQPSLHATVLMTPAPQVHAPGYILAATMRHSLAATKYIYISAPHSTPVTTAHRSH